MLEEYLDGPEVDVDLVVSEGEAVYGAITDNWPTVEPYFNETGSNCPSVLPTKQQQELMQMAVQSTHCLGFKQVCYAYCSWPHMSRACSGLFASANALQTSCCIGHSGHSTSIKCVNGSLILQHTCSTAQLPQLQGSLTEMQPSACRKGHSVWSRQCQAGPQESPPCSWALPFFDVCTACLSNCIAQDLLCKI